MLPLQRAWQLQAEYRLLQGHVLIAHRSNSHALYSVQEYLSQQTNSGQVSARADDDLRLTIDTATLLDLYTSLVRVKMKCR